MRFVLFGLVGVLIAGAFAFCPCEKTTFANDFLRVHIRANSNSEKDQDVKFIVKEKVVEFLTPYLAFCETKEEAEKTLRSLEKEIEEVANQTLEENGFSYQSNCTIKEESFPARAYENLTLESGIYDAMILELGTGTGDNWWCVIYPPLCFVSSPNGEVSYRSKIIEIINDWNNA